MTHADADARVVITGLGPVTNIGFGRTDFCRSLRAGRCGISAISGFDVSSFEVRVAGQVQSFEPARWVRNQAIEALGRASLLSVAGARLAIEDAGLDERELVDLPVSIVLGTTEPEPLSAEELVLLLCQGRGRDVPERLLRQLPAQRLAEAVADEFGTCGEATTVSAACAAGNVALGLAYDMIVSGEATLAIAGGAESFSRKAYCGFYRLGAIDPRHCRPFDRARAGIAPAEGAGLLVLERLDRARARGAHIYAELAGYGLSCDAHKMMIPDFDGVVRAIGAAHARANVHPAQIDYICAHGTGTQANDATESAAIRALFAVPPPTSSIKSMLGHTMGAASALGAIACALSIEHGFLPPTIHIDEPDPDCVPDCVANHARAHSVRWAQNDAFGFGGNNCVLIMRRLEET